jgi:stress responsive alpha/beta barrel protein
VFRHVVMVRFIDGVTEEQLQTVRDGLRALPDEIPEIRSYRFGDDAGLAPDNFDFALVADFDTEDDFLVYRDHPVHRKVIVDHIWPISAERAAVQYEWHSALNPDLPA